MSEQEEDVCQECDCQEQGTKECSPKKRGRKASNPIPAEALLSCIDVSAGTISKTKIKEMANHWKKKENTIYQYAINAYRQTAHEKKRIKKIA